MIDLETVGILVLTAIASSVVVTFIMPKPKPPGKPKKYGESIRKKRMLRKNVR